MLSLRRRFMGANAKPYDAEIEYLQTNGYQYIDTGFSDEISEFELVFESLSRIAGVFISKSKTYYWNKFLITASNFGLHFGLDSMVYRDFKAETIYTLRYRNGNFKLFEGAQEVFSINEYYIEEQDANYVLFGCDKQQTSGRLYSFKIPGIFDMIPVRVGNDGYMYDKISRRLFGNANPSGAPFILGPDI